MNKIGFSILVLAIFTAVSCSCQNWFWSHCGETEPTPCTEGYGLLYNWYAATDTRKISSSDDWVVPTSTQLNTFIASVGANNAYSILDTDYWSPNNGTNATGFNLRGSGIRDTEFSGGSFLDQQAIAFMWTSTQYNINNGNCLVIEVSNTAINNSYYNKKSGMPVRLLYVGGGAINQYTGNDGKVYRVVLIGTQYWLADNLQETKFRDGSIIQWYGSQKTNYFTNTEWSNLTTAGMCAYNNDVANVGCDFEWPIE